MQFRLRTLLILLAVGPPAVGFAALLSAVKPVAAVLIVMWSVAFIVSLTSGLQSKTRLGLMIAECLVVIAIVALILDLLGPYWQSARHNNYGYGS